MKSKKGKRILLLIDKKPFAWAMCRVFENAMISKLIDDAQDLNSAVLDVDYEISDKKGLEIGGDLRFSRNMHAPINFIYFQKFEFPESENFNWLKEYKKLNFFLNKLPLNLSSFFQNYEEKINIKLQQFQYYKKQFCIWRYSEHLAKIKHSVGPTIGIIRNTTDEDVLFKLFAKEKAALIKYYENIPNFVTELCSCINKDVDTQQILNDTRKIINLLNQTDSKSLFKQVILKLKQSIIDVEDFLKCMWELLWVKGK